VHDAPRFVEVDGLGFRSCGGDADARTLEAPSGARVTLRPWTLTVHLAAIDAAMRVDADQLRFDAATFAAAVLTHCGADPNSAELAPAALWWAAGADADPPAPLGQDGWLPLTRGRVRLQPWSWADRNRAVDASRVAGQDPEFRLSPYLAAMLRATVVQTEDVDPDELAGVDAQHLLAAVIAVNTAQGPLEDMLAAATPALAGRLAADTLRLCRALGWTPSQVWSMPAVEVERLLALLGRAEAPAPAAPPRPPAPVHTSRLAAYPDAVVIRVEND